MHDIADCCGKTRVVGCGQRGDRHGVLDAENVDLAVFLDTGGVEQRAGSADHDVRRAAHLLHDLAEGDCAAGGFWMQQDNLTVSQMRNHLARHAFVIDGGQHKDDVVRAVHCFANVGGGKLNGADTFDRVMQGDGFRFVQLVDRLLHDVVQTNLLTEEREMTCHGLPAIAAADNCPDFLCTHNQCSAFHDCRFCFILPAAFIRRSRYSRYRTRASPDRSECPDPECQ